jgi:hypothetical protein
LADFAEDDCRVDRRLDKIQAVNEVGSPAGRRTVLLMVRRCCLFLLAAVQRALALLSATSWSAFLELLVDKAAHWILETDRQTTALVADRGPEDELGLKTAKPSSLRNIKYPIVINIEN